MMEVSNKGGRPNRDWYGKRVADICRDALNRTKCRSASTEPSTPTGNGPKEMNNGNFWCHISEECVWQSIEAYQKGAFERDGASFGETLSELWSPARLELDPALCDVINFCRVLRSDRPAKLYSLRMKILSCGQNSNKNNLEGKKMRRKQLKLPFSLFLQSLWPWKLKRMWLVLHSY